MWSPWRLPKHKIDALEIPPLPKGLYFCFYRRAVCHCEVYLRRRVLGGLFFRTVGKGFAWKDARSSYQEAVEKVLHDAQDWLHRDTNWERVA